MALVSTNRWVKQNNNLSLYYTYFLFTWLIIGCVVCLVVSDSLWLFAFPRLLCPWGFSRQEYWSGFPGPPPGNLPSLGTELRSPALQADSLPSEPPEKPCNIGRTFTTYLYIYLTFYFYFCLILLTDSLPWRSLVQEMRKSESCLEYCF